MGRFGRRPLRVQSLFIVWKKTKYFVLKRQSNSDFITSQHLSKKLSTKRESRHGKQVGSTQVSYFWQIYIHTHCSVKKVLNTNVLRTGSLQGHLPYSSPKLWWSIAYDTELMPSMLVCNLISWLGGPSLCLTMSGERLAFNMATPHLKHVRYISEINLKSQNPLKTPNSHTENRFVSDHETLHWSQWTRGNLG